MRLNPHYILSYRTSLPAVRYGRSLSIYTDDSPHLFYRGVGRDSVKERQLVLIIDPAHIASSSYLPQNQSQRIHIRSLERVKVTHVHRVFQNLQQKKDIGAT